jgi:hypothetical protein
LTGLVIADFLLLPLLLLLSQSLSPSLFLSLVTLSLLFSSKPSSCLLPLPFLPVIALAPVTVTGIFVCC